MADIATPVTIPTAPAPGIGTSEFYVTLLTGGLSALIIYASQSFTATSQVWLAALALVVMLLTGTIYCVQRFVLKTQNANILADAVKAYQIIQAADVKAGRSDLPELAPEVLAVATQSVSAFVPTSAPAPVPAPQADAVSIATGK